MRCFASFCLCTYTLTSQMCCIPSSGLHVALELALTFTSRCSDMLKMHWLQTCFIFCLSLWKVKAERRTCHSGTIMQSDQAVFCVCRLCLSFGPCLFWITGTNWHQKCILEEYKEDDEYEDHRLGNKVQNETKKTAAAESFAIVAKWKQGSDGCNRCHR